MKQIPKKAYKLAAFATAVTCVVVALGAFTRLVDAGLGCPDWPGCYGHLDWPSTAEEIQRAEQAFPDAPVESDKTWPEMVHRYFASSLGILIIGVCYLCWRARKEGEEDQPIKLPFFLLGLVILQGLFGMWTVTLKLWPQVVTAHLLGGFATLSCLWLLTQRLAGFGWRLPEADLGRVLKLKSLALIAMFVLVLQIALGGWTSSNYAALACLDLPTCHGEWLPDTDFKTGFNVTQAIGPNYLGGLMDNDARTAIHLSHRAGAIVVTLLLLFLAWRLYRIPTAETQRMAGVLVAVLALQVGLGLSNIIWMIPLPVAVAHNGVGALLLLVLVTLNHRVFTARK